MNEIKECLRCKSSNIVKCYVNTKVSLNCEPTKKQGLTTQIVYSPTDAIICKDCGHVELIVDWSKI